MSSTPIGVIRHPVVRADLDQFKTSSFGDMVKAVVDIEQRIMAVGGDLHADEEALLLAEGARQADLWGINLYLDLPLDEWLEFDSMINVRPSQGNRSRSVEDRTIQETIKEIVRYLIRA